MNGKILSIEDEPGGTLRLTMQLEDGKTVVFSGCLITGFEQTFEPEDRDPGKKITAEELKWSPINLTKEDKNDEE